MHADIARHRAAIMALCQRHHVARLEIFGSAARGDDFQPARSDVDFLVTFEPSYNYDLAAFIELAEALEAILGRPVDLVDRQALEESQNYIRRRSILTDAEPVYGWPGCRIFIGHAASVAGGGSICR